MSRSSLAAGFAPKPLPKLAARTVVAEFVAGRFENAASLADDARLVVNMPEALHRKVKLRAVERGITIREYVLGLLANDGLLQRRTDVYRDTRLSGSCLMSMPLDLNRCEGVASRRMAQDNSLTGVRPRHSCLLRLLPAFALLALAGCKTGPEKAVLGFVGEEACATRAAGLDAKEDEPLVGQAPSCPQKHSVVEHEGCKRLTGNGACIAHGRATKDGPDLVDYCLSKSGDAFKVDAGCTAAAALVRAYYASEKCEERAKLLFAPEENKEQLALVTSRQKVCNADVKALDLGACQGALHAKDGRCIVKTTVGDKTAEVCVRRDADKLSVDLRCTEMLDGPDGKRVVVKPTKNYTENHPEKDFVSVDVIVSDSAEPKKAWLRRDDKRARLAKLRDAAGESKVVARTAAYDQGAYDQNKALEVVAVVGEGGWQLPAPVPPALGKCAEGMKFVPGFTEWQPSTFLETGRVLEGPAFCMNTTEVTTAAYAACVKSGKCTKAATWDGCNAGVAGRENHAINCVDWNQAKGYCEAQGQRLPTEAEWEYAATGGDGRTYPWGNAEPSNQLCWSATSNGHTCAVGSYPSDNSPFGLSDLSGNVSEWTSTLDKLATRVVRGGSWSTDGPSLVRSAYRHWFVPSYRWGNLGFRCAGSPLP